MNNHLLPKICFPNFAHKIRSKIIRRRLKGTIGTPVQDELVGRPEDVGKTPSGTEQADCGLL